MQIKAIRVSEKYTLKIQTNSFEYLSRLHFICKILFSKTLSSLLRENISTHKIVRFASEKQHDNPTNSGPQTMASFGVQTADNMK